MSIAGGIVLTLMGVFLLGCIYYLLRFVFRLITGDRYVEPKILKSISKDKQPKEKTQKNKLSNIVLVLISMSLSYLYFVVYEPDAKYRLTAKAIVNDFKNNEIAAHSKYEGEFVIVGGTLADSGVLSGSAWVLIDAGVWKSDVQCTLNSDGAKQAEKLKAGQKVKLKGRVLGIEGNVILDRCSLVM